MKLFNWKYASKMIKTEWFWRCTCIFLSKFEVLYVPVSAKYAKITKYHRIWRYSCNCHLCALFQSILGPLVQLPMFVSFFFGIRGMAYLPVESFKTGGYLWFQDLTLYDPYFVLPFICSFSMLASIEVNTHEIHCSSFLRTDLLCSKDVTVLSLLKLISNS